MSEDHPRRRASDPHDNNELWTKLYENGRKVSKLEGQVDDLKLCSDRKAGPATWVGVVLVALGSVTGLVFGITELVLRPLEVSIATLKSELSDLEEFEKNTQYQLGVLDEWKNAKN